MHHSQQNPELEACGRKNKTQKLVVDHEPPPILTASGRAQLRKSYFDHRFFELTRDEQNPKVQETTVDMDSACRVLPDSQTWTKTTQ